jgi:hypothetical protein
VKHNNRSDKYKYWPTNLREINHIGGQGRDGKMNSKVDEDSSPRILELSVTIL